ncbi:hypothetical protein [Cedecea sp. NFIX57]|uniref:hypothetical protein n=1 Tax=Cedecea sp. NFIX57 TaxID=1566286 RepID=UPI00111BD94E|nr:hypothetical protein [Cedecea sp. NFIX57]
MALSVLSGMFLASSAMAAPTSSDWIGKGQTQTATFTVSADTSLTFGASTATTFEGIVRAGEPIFDLTVTAPQGVKVAIGGVNQGISVSGACIRSDEYITGKREIVARVADSGLIKGNEYLPDGAAQKDNSAVGTIVVDGAGDAEVKINSVAGADYFNNIEGKHNYTFIAQAFNV